MIRKVEVEEFLNLRDNYFTLVDVRSPKEFETSHIEGAISIPLFTDEERAKVGTLYKQINREAAILKALEFIGPKMAGFVRELSKRTQKKTVLVHCWRGGMRSESMAWLFEMAGYEVTYLIGGYKAYRNYILNSFEEKARLVVLGGRTGSGKSAFLHELVKANEQVIDLEGLANHKGSAFGAIGQQPQPTTQQFENMLHEKWRTLDLTKPIWIEDESAAIGKVSIPRHLFLQIRSCPVIEIVQPTAVRAKRIIREYAYFGDKLLEESILKISKRLGGLSTTMCLEAVKNQEYEKAVMLILEYYDKAYNNGLDKRDSHTVFPFEVSQDEPAKYCFDLIKYAAKCGL